MKTDPKTILNVDIRLGYETCLNEHKEEIELGTSILSVLDKRYEFIKEDYD